MRSGPAVLILAGLTGFGCLVSFDGYRAVENSDETAAGGTDSSGGEGATGAEGGTSGGSVSQGGTAGRGGAGGANPSGGDGTSGASGKGGDAGSTATGGDAGASTGGASTGGTAGSGGRATGGMAGGGRSTGGASTGGMAGGGTAGGGSGGSSGGATCPQNGRGPAMIEIASPGGSFCIDRSEVTNGMYAVFLDDAASVGGQDPVCTWNTTYVPQTGASCDPLPYDPIGRTNAPVACVDWCDAKKFCEWSGKRLCGAIGGGPVPLGSFDDEATDAWYQVCTRNGARVLPYGNTYEGSFCVGIDYGVVRPANVATVANCQGGYDAVWDMSGNVSEWEDACDASAGAADRCAHRGGAWYDLQAGAPLYCNSSLPSDTTPMPEVLRRDTRDTHVGFRCCADL